jgi:hypothetical protein
VTEAISMSDTRSLTWLATISLALKDSPSLGETPSANQLSTDQTLSQSVDGTRTLALAQSASLTTEASRSDTRNVSLTANTSRSRDAATGTATNQQSKSRPRVSRSASISVTSSESATRSRSFPSKSQSLSEEQLATHSANASETLTYSPSGLQGTLSETTSDSILLHSASVSWSYTAGSSTRTDSINGSATATRSLQPFDVSNLTAEVSAPPSFVIDDCRIKAGSHVNITLSGLPLQTISPDDSLSLASIELDGGNENEEGCDDLINASEKTIIEFYRVSSTQWRSEKSTAFLTGRFVACYFSQILMLWLQFPIPACRNLQLVASLVSVSGGASFSPRQPRAGRDFNVTLDVFGARPHSDQLSIIAVANYTGEESCSNVEPTRYNFSSTVVVSRPLGAAEASQNSPHSQLVFSFTSVDVAGVFLLCLFAYPYAQFESAGVMSIAGSVASALLVGNFSKQGHPAVIRAAGFGVDAESDVFFVSSELNCTETSEPSTVSMHVNEEPMNEDNSAMDLNVSVVLTRPYLSFLCYVSHLAPQYAEVVTSFFTSPVEPTSFLPAAAAGAAESWAIGQDLVVRLVGDPAVRNREDTLYLQSVTDAAAGANCSRSSSSTSLRLVSLADVLPGFDDPVLHRDLFALSNLSLSGRFILCFRARLTNSDSFSRVGNEFVTVRSSFFNTSRLAVTIGERVVLKSSAFALRHDISSVFLVNEREQRCPPQNTTPHHDADFLMSGMSSVVSLDATHRGFFSVCWVTQTGAVLRSHEVITVAPVAPEGISLRAARSLLENVVALVGGRGFDLVAPSSPDAVIVCPPYLRQNETHNGTARIVPNSPTIFTVMPGALSSVDLCFLPGISVDGTHNVSFLGTMTVLPGVRNISAHPPAIKRGNSTLILVDGIGLRSQDQLLACPNTSITGWSATLLSSSESRTVWNLTVFGFSGVLRLCYTFAVREENITNVPFVFVYIDPSTMITFSPSNVLARTPTKFLISDEQSTVGGIRDVFFAASILCDGLGSRYAGSSVLSDSSSSSSAGLFSVEMFTPIRGVYFVCVTTSSNVTLPLEGSVKVFPFVSSARAETAPFTDVPFTMEFQGGDIGRVASLDVMFLVAAPENCTAGSRIFTQAAIANNTVKGTLRVQFVLSLSGVYRACALLDESSLGLGLVAVAANSSIVNISSSLVYDASQQLLVLRGPSLSLNQASSSYAFYFSVLSSSGDLMKLAMNDGAQRTQLLEANRSPFVFVPYLPYGIIEFSCEVFVGSVAVRAHRLQLEISVNLSFCNSFPSEPSAVRTVSWNPDSSMWMFASAVVLLHDFNTARCAALPGAPSAVPLRDHVLSLVSSTPELVTAPLFVFLTLADILSSTPPVGVATVGAARSLLSYSEASLSAFENVSSDRVLAHLVIVDSVQSVLQSNMNNSLLAAEVQSIAVQIYQRLQLMAAKACSSDAIRSQANGSLVLSFRQSGLSVALDSTATRLDAPLLNVSLVFDLASPCTSAAPLLRNVLPQGKQTGGRSEARRTASALALPGPGSGAADLPVFSVLSRAFIAGAVFEYTIPPYVLERVAPAVSASSLAFSVSAVIYQFIFNVGGESGYWVALPSASVSISGTLMTVGVEASPLGSQMTKRGEAALIISGHYVLTPKLPADHERDWYLIAWTIFVGLMQVLVLSAARCLHRRSTRNGVAFTNVAPPTFRAPLEHDESADFEEVVFELETSDSERASVARTNSSAKHAVSLKKKKGLDVISSSSGEGTEKMKLGRAQGGAPAVAITTAPLQREDRESLYPPRWAFLLAMRKQPKRAAFDSVSSFSSASLITLYCVYVLEYYPAYTLTPASSTSISYVMRNAAVCGAQAAAVASVFIGLTRSASAGSLSSLAAALSAAITGAVLLQTTPSSEVNSSALSRILVVAAGTGVATWLVAFTLRWLLASFASFGNVLPRCLMSKGARQAVKGATLTVTALLGSGAAVATLFIAVVPGTLLSWRPLLDHFQAIGVGLVADFIADFAVSLVKAFLDGKVLSRRKRYLAKTRIRSSATSVVPPTAAANTRPKDAFEPFPFDEQSTVHEELPDSDDMYVLQFQSLSDQSSTNDDQSSVGTKEIRGGKGHRKRSRAKHQPFKDSDFALPVFEQKAYCQPGTKTFVLVDEIASEDDESEDGDFDSIESSSPRSSRSVAARAARSVPEEISDDSDWQFDEVDSSHALDLVTAPAAVEEQPALKKPTVSLAAIASEVLRNASGATAATEHLMYRKFRMGAKSFRNTSRPHLNDPFEDLPLEASTGGDVRDPARESRRQQQPTQDSFIIDVEMQQSEGSSSFPSSPASEDRNRTQSSSDVHQPTMQAFEGAAMLSRRALQAAGLDAEARNPFQFDFVAAQRYE